MNLFFNHFDNPLARKLREFAIALEFIYFTVVTWQDANHGFTLLTKLCNGVSQIGGYSPRRPNGRLQGQGWHNANPLF
jgi:hypothetical protein